MKELVKEYIKTAIKDTEYEPYLRWLVKRSRGLRMPFDLVKNEIYDRQAAEVIARVLRDSSTAIDAGCHKGQFLRLFLKHAPHGHHYAFEPIPHLAKMLLAHFPSVEIYNYALSNRSGAATFYVIPDSLAQSGLNERAFVAKDRPREAITVKTELLDTIIPNDTNIDLVKIDVEGAEGLVIAGAINTIKRSKPYIIFEHGGASSRAFGVSSANLYDMLVEDCGLRLSLLRNWLKGGPSLSRREFAESQNWYFLAHPTA